MSIAHCQDTLRSTHGLPQLPPKAGKGRQKTQTPPPRPCPLTIICFSGMKSALCLTRSNILARWGLMKASSGRYQKSAEGYPSEGRRMGQEQSSPLHGPQGCGQRLQGGHRAPGWAVHTPGAPQPTTEAGDSLPWGAGGVCAARGPRHGAAGAMAC